MKSRNIIVVLVICLVPSGFTLTRSDECFEFICGPVSNPICGSDGVTYENGCKYSQAQCKNRDLVIVKLGKCDEGSEADAVTHEPEMSMMETVASTMPAPPKPTSEMTPVTNLPTSSTCVKKICPLKENPICASNGRTYRNACEFDQARCYHNKLSIVHRGVCEENFKPTLALDCNWQCAEEIRPLCATNGVTYGNICNFEKAKCAGSEIKIYKFGPC